MIKIYVDGFKIEEVPELPNSAEELEQLPEVKLALAGKKVVQVIAIPSDLPRLVLIATEL